MASWQGEEGAGVRTAVSMALCVSLEVRVETFTPKRAFDEPVDRLGRVGHLLRGGHHIWRPGFTPECSSVSERVERLKNCSVLSIGDRLVCE